MNRLANRVLKVAAVAGVCGFAAVGNAADWVRSYEGGWNILIEQVEEGATPWKLRIIDLPNDGETAIGIGTDGSSNNNAVYQTGSHSVIDLTGTVSDAMKTYVIKSIGTNAFRTNTAITGIKVPDSLARIKLAAFYGCTNLVSFEPFLPDSVSEIGWAVFTNCRNLKGDLVVRNPNVTMGTSSKNEDATFYNCAAITSADFSESGLTTLPRCCFYNCNALLWAKLPKSYANFDNAAAFYYAKGLIDVSFKSFPTSMPGDVFKGTVDVTKGARITYPGNSADWDSFVRKNSFKAWDEATSYQATYNEMWPDGPQPIGYCTIGGQTKWAVPIVEVVTDCRLTIGGVDTSGAALNIGTVSPDYCESKTITEDSVVCTADEFATAGNYGYQCIGYRIGTLEGSTIVYGDVVPSREYTFIGGEAGEHYLRWVWEKVAAKMTVAAFPEEFGEVAVSGSDYQGFENFRALDTEVTFTATPKGDATFGSWCGTVPDGQRFENPLTLTVNDTKTVTPYFVSKWVFNAQMTAVDDGYWTMPVSGDRNALTVGAPTQKGTVTVLDLVKEIEGGGAFKTVPVKWLNNANPQRPQTDVLLPDSITTIGERAFEGNTMIRRIRLPSELKRIEIATFWGCTALESVEPFLPKSVEFVGWAAFTNCKNLKGDLVLANRRLVMQTGSEYNYGPCASCAITSADLSRSGLVDPPYCFFISCSKLEKVHMPRTLKKIAATFHLCTALKDVQFESFPTNFNASTDSFKSNPSGDKSRLVYQKGDPGWEAYIAEQKQAGNFIAWEDAGKSGRKTNDYLTAFSDHWKPVGYIVVHKGSASGNIGKWFVPHNFNAGTTILLR